MYMKFERATVADAHEISALMNLAYRGAQGWTTESHLIEGARCAVQDIEDEIRSPNTYYFIYRTALSINACIAVTQQDEKAYIGSFAVLPELQNTGVGKQLLMHAEQFAQHELNVRQLAMVVLSNRDELIAFYQRRGYQRSGNIQGYPIHLNVGQPVYLDQTVEELVKYCGAI